MLAGRACPATDEQLAALGRRRKRPAAPGIARGILRRDKAKRYLMYGVGLMLLHVATGLNYYQVPGAVCLVLGTLCRCMPGVPEEL